MTLINFNPSPYANFQFSPTLDGGTYTAIITWNAYSTRYYLSIYDNFGALKVSVPVIPSPDEYDINLVKGFFTSSIVFRQSSNNFEVV